MSQPEIALLVSTYQRPGHLSRALRSIALQQGVAGRFEVVVTDDGSTDETAELVRRFAREVDFPVSFTTHAHTAFCLSRCRNEGVAASRAAYLLFLDGDCILPPDHVWKHLDHRQPGVAMAGDCCRLDQKLSERIGENEIASGNYRPHAPLAEIKRLRRLDRKSRIYTWLRHPTKPKLIGNNVGIWRADYERVNGYDENFEGWGCEDDDLRYRLRRAGVRIQSILRWTHTYHLWHPVHATQPKNWSEGLNVRYLLQPGRLTRCRNGLVKRNVSDLAVRVLADAASSTRVERLIGSHLPQMRDAGQPEVEIVVLPGDARFSGQADCNVLVALEDSPRVDRLAAQAHIVVGPKRYGRLAPERQFRLDQLLAALQAVA